ncbi:MAG TPA: PadR family transcriptional regulator [Candidatus Limnocylindrales bacterium]
MFDPFKGYGADRGRGPGRDWRGPGPTFDIFFRRGHPAFGGRRASMRRGDVRLAILALLNDGPMHGYQVMQELESRSGGVWRPSAGSVYPTLQQLEDEGLVRSEELDGRRTYSLTDAGRAEAASRAGARAPWEAAEFEDAVDIRKLSMQLVWAAMQVSRIGTTRSIAEARDILVDARRRLYRLLAEDEPSDEGKAADR